MAHSHTRQKIIVLYAIQTGAVATHCFLFFQLLFDTATLGILEAQKLRMLKARGCKQRLKSDLLYRILYACMHYLQQCYSVL